MSRKSQIAIVIVFFIFLGCKVSRDVKRDKTRDFTELTKDNLTKIKRVGDTVITKDLYKYKFKDTTIYNVNRVTGTTQVVRYDNQGNIKELECLSGHIDVIERQNERLLTLLENDKKDTSKEFEIKPSIIIYFCIAIILIIIAGFYIIKKSLVPT